MKIIKDLTCEVTYTVGLGNLKVPDDVYAGLCEMFDKGSKISHISSSEGQSKNMVSALEWLRDNIKERDSMDWICEILDLI
jgi:hypothetical protein